MVSAAEHRGILNRWRARRWGRRHGMGVCPHPPAMREAHLVDIGRGKVIACRLCRAITVI